MWIVPFFLVVLLLQEYFHRKERQDLYNRLMSKDLQEYKNVNAPAFKPKTNNPLRDNIKKAQKEANGGP
jgi:hypothetical protein